MSDQDVCAVLQALESVIKDAIPNNKLYLLSSITEVEFNALKKMRWILRQMKEEELENV